MLYEHFRDPSMNAQQFNFNSVAPADYHDRCIQTHSFEDIHGCVALGAAQTDRGRGELPELVSAGGGSWNLFPLLGEPAVMLAWTWLQRLKSQGRRRLRKDNGTRCSALLVIPATGGPLGYRYAALKTLLKRSNTSKPRPLAIAGGASVRRCGRFARTDGRRRGSA
jgi:hypothetical protein